MWFDLHVLYTRLRNTLYSVKNQALPNMRHIERTVWLTSILLDAKCDNKARNQNMERELESTSHEALVFFDFVDNVFFSLNPMSRNVNKLRNFKIQDNVVLYARTHRNIIGFRGDELVFATISAKICCAL